MRSWWLRLTVVLALLGATTPAPARSLGRTSFVDKAAGIRIFLPPRWALQVRSALPGLVAAFRHPTGARLVLSSRNRRGEESAQQLATRNIVPLRKQGWAVTPPVGIQLGTLPALQMEATDAGGKTRLFQIYAVREKFAYVLTLTVPETQRGRLAGDLRFLTKTARFAK